MFWTRYPRVFPLSCVWWWSSWWRWSCAVVSSAWWCSILGALSCVQRYSRATFIVNVWIKFAFEYFIFVMTTTLQVYIGYFNSSVPSDHVCVCACVRAYFTFIHVCVWSPPQAGTIANISSSIVNLGLILLMGRVYTALAEQLTKWGKYQYCSLTPRTSILYIDISLSLETANWDYSKGR